MLTAADTSFSNVKIEMQLENIQKLVSGYFLDIDTRGSSINNGSLMSIRTISALFSGRNLDTIFHFVAWSAIPKSPWGIQLTSKVTNRPSFISFFFSFFFSHNSHGIQAVDKEGLCQRDPLLALMRGPGRRGTPGLVQACLNLLCCRHYSHHLIWPFKFYSY